MPSKYAAQRDTYPASGIVEFAVDFTAALAGDLAFSVLVPGLDHALIVVGEQIVDDVLGVESLQRGEQGELEHSTNISKAHLIVIIIASTAATVVTAAASVASTAVVVPAASATLLSVLVIVASEEAGQPSAVAPVVVIAVAAIHTVVAVAVGNLDIDGLGDLDVDVRGGNGRSRQGGEDEGVTHFGF